MHRLLRGHRGGRRKDAATIETTRHYNKTSAPLRIGRGRLRAEMHRLLRGNRGRRAKGAATIEQVHHRAMGSAGEGRSGRHLLASKARANGGAAAAVGKRRRERDAELQIQTPRLTVRRYEKWGTNIPGRATVGGRRRTSRSAVARKACVRARWSAVRGNGGTDARVSVFFIHIHPRLRRRAPRRGGKADRSVQRPVRLVRCVGHGVGARGVGAVRLHARGGARGTGRAGQRGGMRRGVKPIAQRG